MRNGVLKATSDSPIWIFRNRIINIIRGSDPKGSLFFVWVFNLFVIFTFFKMTVGRILAIDYGRKRTGLAVTDPGRIIANGLETVSTHLVMEYLDKFFSKEKVDIVVVGYPKQMNNQPSEAVEYINPFVKKLRNKFSDLQIDLFDERFTSKMAFQTMIDAGLGKKDRQNKGLIDKISATILLQSYLDSIKQNK